MSSDFKNIFIGANNSKRTKSNLIDNEKDPLSYQFPFAVIDANLKEY